MSKNTVEPRYLKARLQRMALDERAILLEHEALIRLIGGIHAAYAPQSETP